MIIVKALSLEMSKKMADAAEEKAKENELKIVISILDNHENLKYL
jgi:uncharacterized protein GlcG (DUF336 family)